MKKIVFVTLLFASLMLHAAESSATVTNNDGKSQVETTKQIQPTRYNFTLFSFFNYVEKQKVDSASTVGNNGAQVKKKPDDN